MVPPQPSELPREGMKDLAAAIKARREQRTLAKHLPMFEELAQQMEQWGKKQPEIRPLVNLDEGIQTVESSAEVEAERVEERQKPEVEQPKKPSVSQEQALYEQLALKYPTDDLILVAAHKKWGMEKARQVIAYSPKGRKLKGGALDSYIDGVQKGAAQRVAAHQRRLEQQQNQKKKKRRRGR